MSAVQTAAAIMSSRNRIEHVLAMWRGEGADALMIRDLEMAYGDSLDAAWAEVEAVLPQSRGRWGYSIHGLTYTTRGWQATASGEWSGEWVQGYGATPAAALQALAAKLRESKL